MRFLFLFLAVYALPFQGCCETGPRFVVEPPRELIVWYKEGGIANCVASGSPEPRITWYLTGENTPLQPVPKVRRVLENGSLFFPPFRAEEFRPDVHLASYRCLAANSAGKLLSMDMVVRSVVVENYDATAQVVSGPLSLGNTAILKCRIPQHLDGVVAVTAWIIDDSYNIYPTTDGGGKYVMLSWNGDLHILNLSRSDTKRKYTCRTLHRLSGRSQHSNAVTLLVNEISTSTGVELMVPADSTITTRQTSDIILPCVANSYPPPSYQWLKNNVPIELNERKLMAGGSLLLRSVAAEDSGQYACVANSSTSSVKSQVNLVIPKTLMVHINPQNLQVDSGAKAVFECVSSATQIFWYKDGIDKGVYAPTLEIPSVGRSDQGVYQCRVSQNGEQNYAIAELRLGASKPQLIYQFLEHTLQPGPPVSLKCIATGNPTPHITWNLDGYPLPQNDRFIIGQYVSMSGDVISHVNLTKVAVEDGGMYSCKATNRAGSSEHQAPLRVYGSPVIRSIPALSAVAGQSVTINCPVGGYPIHTKTWEKDGKPLSTSHRVKVFNNGTLSISNVQTKIDQGSYKCIASNRQGHTARATVEVTVLEPPVLSGLEPTRVGLVGERLGLQCLVIRGQVPISLHWQRAETPVLKLNLPSISISSPAEYSSTLLFENLNLLHTGNYTCVATNSAATVSATVQLFVNEPPEITPFTVPVLEAGSRLQATCTVHKGDPPLNISWSKDGINVTQDVSVYNLYTSILSIAQVTRRDSGNYTCRAVNQASTVEHTAELIVTVPPEWVVEPHDMNVVVGQPVQLHCSADGYPKPTLTWRKSVGKDSTQFGEKLSGTENGTYSIGTATEDDEGFYLCEAHNEIGAGLSSVIFLRVNALPNFLPGGRKALTTRGNSAVLKCEARGDLPLMVKWQRNHITISETSEKYELKETFIEDTKIIKSQLIVKNTVQSDSGKYVCTASNAFGNDEMVVHLSIQDVPESPKDVRIVETSSRSLKISWAQAQDNNSPLLHYSIAFTKDPGEWNEKNDNWLNSEDTKELWTWYEIQHLHPSTKYHIRVFAVNEVGMSPPSHVVSAKTGPEIPSGPPIEISATPVSNSKIEIKWKPPVPEHRNAPITGYTIGFKRAADEVYNYTNLEMPSDVDRPTFSISGLKSFTKYEITIQAVNIMGNGIASQPLQVTTLEAAPEESPKDVSCKPMSSQRLDVRWSKPPKSKQNGKILGYKLTYLKVPPDNDIMTETFEESKKSDRESFILTSLEKYTKYSIKVSAFTVAGMGPESVPVFCTTLESAPGPPEKLKVVQSNPQNVIISWLPPSKPYGHLNNYKLHQREVSLGNAVQVRSLDPDITYLTLGVKIGITYEWWMSAVNSAGESTYTQTLTFSPSEKILARIYSIGKEQSVALGSKLDLPCNSVGIPSPMTVWKQNGDDISSSSVYKIWSNKTLTISPVTNKHDGNYTCIVKNSHGSNQISYVVNVIGPPSAPKLHMVMATVHNITIGWGRPQHALALLGYKLMYRIFNKTQNWREVSLSNSVDEFTISNLQCGTTVEAKICAENRVGMGTFSDILALSTLAPPPEPPLPDQALTTTSNTIIIHLELWRYFECPVTHFIIERKMRNSNWHLVGEWLPGSKYVMSGLKSSTFYQICIISHTSAGQISHYFHTTTKAAEGEASQMDNPWEPREQPKPFYLDWHTTLPIIASILALVLAVVTIVICLKHKIWQCTNMEEPAAEAVPHPEYYSAIDRKAEHPHRGEPEYADDIYPYATFQMPKANKEKLPHDFQPFLYQGSSIVDVNHYPTPKNKHYGDRVVPPDEYDSLDDAHFQMSLHRHMKQNRITSMKASSPIEISPHHAKNHTFRKNKYVYTNLIK